MASKPFPDDVVRRALLWCNRHCCVCGRQCGVKIELHHINPDGEGDQENCLPACFDCHSELGHYNNDHPRGRKFRPDELRLRREQVYEQQTRHLFPPTHFKLVAHEHGLPLVKFEALNLGTYPPVGAIIRLTAIVDGMSIGLVKGPHYEGKFPVHLLPQQGFAGWFALPNDCDKFKHRLMVRFDVIIIDPYERQHILPPFGFKYEPAKVSQSPYWFYEPAPDAKEILAI